MSSISYRLLQPGEIGRVPEIDRRELIDGIYRVRAGRLHLEDARLTVPGWDRIELQANLARIRECLERGGSAWGGFDGGRLVGIAVLDGRWIGPAGDTLDLYFLHVSAGYRDRGVGAALMELVVEQATEAGANQLCVSSTPSRHTVRFYRNQGFQLTDTPDPELFELEPDDIHMLRQL